MADIRIEKKKPVWPWLILIIILAVLAFLYFYGSMETDETDDMESTEIEEVTYKDLEKDLYKNEVEFI
ncbi:MAG TPA: ATP-dependent metallopeptidase FtsH/Yme1/Tma family protein [Christiangramia sp.]|nr:ATP-dependent metallopeptidase FtsH/Yme1/Tma family protein [Christiangramia sp.]